MTRKNNDKIFETLLQNYGGLIYRIASTYERRPALIDELVQETTLAIWRAMKHFRHDANIKTYIARITHNVCISHVRKAVKRPEQALEDIYIDKGPQPDDLTASALQRRRLYSAIHTLDLLPRQIISLHLEGFSNKDIAEILGLSANHVAVKLTRIRAALKEKMDISS